MLSALITLGFVVLVIMSVFKILNEYERGVIFFLGRFQKVKGPGIIIVVPFIQKMIKVDLRVIVMDVPTQDVISKDNVSVKVNAVVYFRIIDPEKAIIQVANVFETFFNLSQGSEKSSHAFKEKMNTAMKQPQAVARIKWTEKADEKK